jgi:hypothetical protein
VLVNGPSFHQIFIIALYVKIDRLCGLAVRVGFYRSRGPGSILRNNGSGKAWRARLRSYLKEKVAAPI